MATAKVNHYSKKEVVMSSDNIKVGDRVKFVKVHHAMHRILKSHLNNIGTVTMLSDNMPKKVLVDFGRSRGEIDGDARHWILKTRLRLQDDVVKESTN